MTVFASTATMLAHQGGWDEVLLIGVPIVVIVIVLRIAKKRVDAAVVAPGVEAPGGDTDQRPE